MKTKRLLSLALSIILLLSLLPHAFAMDDIAALYAQQLEEVQKQADAVQAQAADLMEGYNHAVSEAISIVDELQKAGHANPLECDHEHQKTETQEILAPTCTTPGSHLEVTSCEDCTLVLSRETVEDPAAHDYIGEETVPATETEEGEMTYTCSRCGDTYTEPIPALNEEDKEEEETEEDEEDEEPVPFDQSRTVSGVTVRVSAPAGVFPANSELLVDAVPDETVESVLEGERREDEEVVSSYTFDIRVVDENGDELQPKDAQSVTVSFTLAEAADDTLETNVYHISEGAGGALEAEKLATTESGSTVTAETSSFSLYRVETVKGASSPTRGGNTIVVRSSSELAQALQDVSEDTFIQLEGGTYDNSVECTVNSPNAVVTIDLGQGITVNARILVYSELILKASTLGSSTVSQLDVYDGGSVSIKNNVAVTTLPVVSGTVNINGGTVTTLRVGGGTVNISGGTVTTLQVSGGTVNISGGTVTDLNVIPGSSGTVNIYGGTVTTLDGSSHESSTTVIISGGTVTNNNYDGNIPDQPAVIVKAEPAAGGEVAAKQGNMSVSSASDNPAMFVSDGQRVDVTATPNGSYELYKLTYTRSGGEPQPISVEPSEDGKYYRGTFGMPNGSVTVTATFKVPRAITIDDNITNGSVTASINGNTAATAMEGDTVTLTVSPDTSFELESLSVKNGEADVPTTKVNDTTYTFTMPDAPVTVTATFKETATPYPLWVGDQQVTSANLSGQAGSGTWSFEGNASGGTLTLTNATITSAHKDSNLYIDMPLTIQLSGNNNLSGASYAIASGHNITINGDSLEADGSLEGIEINGVLTVEGGSSVTATGITANEGLTIEGGSSVTAKGDTIGVYTENLKIKNSTLDASGGIIAIAGQDNNFVTLEGVSIVKGGKFDFLESDGHYLFIENDYPAKKVLIQPTALYTVTCKTYYANTGTVTAEWNGTPASTISVPAGVPVTVTVTPAEGYSNVGFDTQGDTIIIFQDEIDPCLGTFTMPEENVTVVAYIKKDLTITVKDQKFTYDGQSHGEKEDGATYIDTGEIYNKVDVKGLRDGDKLVEIVLAGEKTEADIYENLIDISYYRIVDSIDKPVTDYYDITELPGTLTIERSDLKVIANDQTYVYNGDLQGPGDITYKDSAEIAKYFTITGMAKTDTLTKIILDGQGDVVNDSGYDLIPSDAAIGVDGKANKNYNFEYVKGTLTIEPRPITIRANDASSEYTGSEITYATASGAVSPYYAITNTAEDEGLADKDSITAIALTGAGTEAGTSDITITKGSVVIETSKEVEDKNVTKNYAITLLPGTLTISQTSTPFTISLEGTTCTYDGTEKAITNIPESTALSGTTTFTYSFEENGTYVPEPGSLTQTDAGTYTVYVQGTNPNYSNGAKTTATLTINQAENPAVITPAAAVSVGGNTVDLSGKVTGAAGAVTYEITTALEGCRVDGATGEFTSGSQTGVCTVTVSVAGNNNYKSATGEIAVTVTDKATAQLAVTQSGITYGETLPDPSYTAPAGVAKTTVSYSGSGYGPTAEKPAEPGDYTVTVTLETADTIYTGSAAFTILSPAAYTVTVSNDGNGSASASPAAGVSGTEVTLSAEPKEGYAFSGWQVITGGVSVKDNKFTIGTENVEVKAEFIKKQPPADLYRYIETTDIWVQNLTQGAAFRIKRSVLDEKTANLLLGIKVDGVTVPQGAYEKESGSVIITLKPAYLMTLDLGKHLLTAVFAESPGEVEVSTWFEIRSGGTYYSSSTSERYTYVPPSNNPRTGDDSHLALWGVLGCLSAAGAMFTAKKRRRKENLKKEVSP